MPLKLLKMLHIRELASLTINIAEKLKMGMVATAHWCLHNLVAGRAYSSREVREPYQSLCCHPCSFSRVLLLSVQLYAIYLERKNLFFFYWAQLMSCDVEW